MSKFTKADLKTGDIVIERGGDTGIIVRPIDTDPVIIWPLEDREFTPTSLSLYLDDLTYKMRDHDCHDIQKVYRPKELPQLDSRSKYYERGELVYDREHDEGVDPIKIKFIYKGRRCNIDLSRPVRIIYDSKSEAEVVLNALKHIMRTRGYATVYDLMGISPLWACDDHRLGTYYGWSDLSEAHVNSEFACCFGYRNHATLCLPQPMELRNETNNERK